MKDKEFPEQKDSYGKQNRQVAWIAEETGKEADKQHGKSKRQIQEEEETGGTGSRRDSRHGKQKRQVRGAEETGMGSRRDRHGK
jgi:hypothetical protein